MAENEGPGTIPLFDGYSLDLSRGSLLQAGAPVHLRPLAFELLRFLVANRGRLVSKDTLVEHVWQGRAVSDDSIVQCLRDVRLALGPGGGRYLRNVRGRGYIFDVDAPMPVEAIAPANVVPADALEVIRVVVDDERPADADERRLRARRWALTLAVVAVIGAAAALAWRGTRTAPSPSIDSIAVLPFTNETGSPDAEYVADGIAETLVNELSRVPDLAVKARASVFRYRGSTLEPRRIGSELGVQTLLSGRLVQRGEEMTLYVALVDARDGNQIWGDDFRERANDVTALPLRVAHEVVDRLRPRLARETGASARRMPPAAAYSLYLRGRHEVRKLTRARILDGVDLYRQALAIDPEYAAAHAALADAWRVLPIAYGTAPVEAFPQAKTAAARAIALDPGLAQPHVVLGWINFWFDWDWPSAEAQLSRALAIDSFSAEAHLAHAHLLSNLGRHDEALAAARRAVELDPVEPVMCALQGQFLMYAGRLDEAEAAHRRALNLEPDFWVALNGLGRVAIRRGRFDEAISLLRQATARSQGSPEPLTQLGYALARAGRTSVAHEALAQLAALARDGYVPAYDMAMVRHGLGDDEAAIADLERSYRQREVQLTFIHVDTRWDDLRSNPRFAAIVRQMNLE